MFVDFWPNASTDVEVIANKLNSIPKVVFSNTLKTASWGKWPSANIISGDFIDAFKKLKSQDGKNIVVWGSINLAQALMKENLVDGSHLQACPTITGGGRPFFLSASIDKRLKLVNT